MKHTSQVKKSLFENKFAAVGISLLIALPVGYFLIIWPIQQEDKNIKTVTDAIKMYCPGATNIRVETYYSKSVDEISGATWRQPDGNTYRWIKPSGINIVPEKQDLNCN